MLRSIGKQSGESVESVPKKKKEGYGGRVCRKKSFKSVLSLFRLVYANVFNYFSLQQRSVQV